MIEFGRFRAHRVSAGRYIVQRRKRSQFFYSGLISRIRPRIDRKKTCWQISGPDVGIVRYGYDTLRSAIHDYEMEAR